MTTDELKPCPFCGGRAFLQPQQGDNPKPFAWDVIHHCGNVGFIRMSPRGLDHKSTKEHAIAAWDTRAKSTEVIALREREARLVEALRFYADESGYEVDLRDYGLSMTKGNVILDAGETARAALAEIEKEARE